MTTAVRSIADKYHRMLNHLQSTVLPAFTCALAHCAQELHLAMKT